MRIGKAVEDGELKHLSNTSIDMYTKCPFRFYCRYPLGLKKPPSAALTFGISFGDATDLNYEQKIVTHEDLKVKKITDRFNDRWKELKSETEFTKKEKPEEIRKIGEKSIEIFQKEIAPIVQPVAIQLFKSVDFEGSDFKFVGKLDVVDNKNVIRDTKTSSSRWKDSAAHDTLQHVGYSLLLDGQSDKERDCTYDIAVKLKTPVTQIIKTKVSKEQRMGFLIHLTRIKMQIQHSIQTGNFPAYKTKEWWCSKRFCGYFRECEKTFGWKIKD